MALELLEEKLELAVLYFKTSNYPKALKVYDELIKLLSNLSIAKVKQIRQEKGFPESPIIGTCVHPSLTSLLDQRAATYEKLDRLNKALFDAEQITKIDPISCKGYLRVGKVLRCMNKEVEAYKAYQTGIYIIEQAARKHGIKVSEKLLIQLKSQYSTLNQKLRSQRLSKTPSTGSNNSSTGGSQETPLNSQLNKMIPLKRNSSQSTSSQKVKVSKPSKAFDPFLYLPLEVIEVIFQQLPIHLILKCHLVSKTWYFCLTNIPSLYNDRFILKPRITVGEFTQGMKLMKSIVHKSYSQQIKNLRLRSVINAVQLKKVIELIIQEPNFSIQNLDLFDTNLNFHLILNRLSKLSWRLNNLKSLQEMKLGLSGSIRYENILLKLFPKLKNLHLVIIDPELNSASNDLIPIQDKRFKQLVETANNELVEFESLQSLVTINHPQLLKSNNKMRVSMNSFNPYPLFLDKGFPNLTELSIASFDFLNRLPLLGEFLIKTTKLTKIILENNVNFKLLDFLQLLKNYNPSFTLTKLVFREEKLNSATNLNEFSLNDLSQLSTLQYLDLYGSSLSTRGLLLFLKICNRSKSLDTLLIGLSGHIYFRTDTFHMGPNHNTLSLSRLIKVVPNLAKLYLNELDIDNLTLKTFNQDLEREIGYQACKLKVLDISFCTKIEGIGLIDLFNATSTNLKRLKRGDQSVECLKLDELIIDGIEINPSTLKLLTDFKFVKVIKNDANKRKWKSFGINSLVIQ
ncbi:hypothetical protein DFJ63DRAFT_263314 [Scheffersomyces coipomensis]|uniref:uncharacterized protein n=1 Tax=Scheffersomyces coipomensis TaxID=1788519 RepID=UPI00315C7A43